MHSLLFVLCFFYCYGDHRDLHSFPTRRSSDLECFLTRKEFVLLKSKLAKHLEDKQDSIRFYPLCASCLEKVETVGGDRKSTRLNSSHEWISYAVFCLKKKKVTTD